MKNETLYLFGFIIGLILLAQLMSYIGADQPFNLLFEAAGVWIAANPLPTALAALFLGLSLSVLSDAAGSRVFGLLIAGVALLFLLVQLVKIFASIAVI